VEISFLRIKTPDGVAECRWHSSGNDRSGAKTEAISFYLMCREERGGMENDMEQMLRVGVIANTHGVHGEVKVFPTTDSQERFLHLKKAILITKRGQIPLEVTGVKFFKQFAILKFKGYDNINDIEMYKGCDLMVTREDAVPLEENEYYIADLLGMDVVTDEGKKLGVLKDVLQTGANDVYVVMTKEGKEILLPVIDECILDVSLEENKVTAHMMPGLLD